MHVGSPPPFSPLNEKALKRSVIKAGHLFLCLIFRIRISSSRGCSACVLLMRNAMQSIGTLPFGVGAARCFDIFALGEQALKRLSVAFLAQFFLFSLCWVHILSHLIALSNPVLWCIFTLVLITFCTPPGAEALLNLSNCDGSFFRF